MKNEINASIICGDLVVNCGDKKLTVPYWINAERSFDAIEGLRQQFVDGAAAGNIEATKSAFDQLLVLIFQETGAQKIVDFYRGDYLTMLVDVGQWIETDLLPEFQNFGKREAKKVKRPWWKFR